jgi:threonyl-tRNA synthetase
MVQAKMRVELDVSNDNINSKIREHSVARIPYIIVVGEKEKESKSVTIRTYGTDKQVTLPVSEFISKVQAKVESKALGFDL